MSNAFTYDVFLSHSAKDKAVVRPLAERLRQDGLKVWFDEWVLKPGDSIPAKIEEGLEHSRVLVLCMSANAFGSDWAQLEAGTFRFRDPLNRELRFIPLRLDDAPIKGSLAQFLYINWLPRNREQEYAKLLEACHSTGNLGRENAAPVSQQGLVPKVKSISPSSGQTHLLSVHVDNKGPTTLDLIQIIIYSSEVGLPYFSTGFWRMGPCHVPYSFDAQQSLNPGMSKRVFEVGFMQDPDEFVFKFTVSARDRFPENWILRYSRKESQDRVWKQADRLI
jgi:hypothetical protein